MGAVNPAVLRSGGDVEAISLDFFNTLAHHRHPRGRGALVMEYLRAHGWASEPWRHAVLYDVFDLHGAAYDPDASASTHRSFCVDVARTLFAVLGVQCGPGVVEEHASALWRLIGPEGFVIFPEVERALGQLRQQGYRLAIVSNWQRGLGSFCRALGLDTHVDVIIASAEVGFAKPDSRIFDLACSRLGRPPDKVLHVGDSPVDDLQGATRAGLRAVLLQREGPPVGSTRTIRDLGDIGTMLLSESSP